MTIWSCTRCGSPNGSITEMCFRCGAPKPGVPGMPAPGMPAPGMPTPGMPTPGMPAPGMPAPGGPSAPPGAGTDEPSLVPLARYDVLPPAGPPTVDQPTYPQPGYEPAAGYPPPMPVPVTPPAGPYQQPPPYEPAPAFVPAHQDSQPYAAPPAPGRERRWWVPVLIGVVVLLAIGAITTVVLVSRDGEEPTGSPPTASAQASVPATPTANPSSPPTAGPSSQSPTTPGSVGVVAIDPAVTDPRTVDVATMFDSHFSAVNAKDYARALAAYDPAGVINPNDPGQAADFQRAISTTTDDQILLRSIGPDPTGRGVLAARVTFRSNQQAGYGPRERPNETCTAWDVTYTITRPGGAYKILAGSATHAPC
jgi:hypothetical protein